VVRGADEEHAVPHEADPVDILEQRVHGPFHRAMVIRHPALGHKVELIDEQDGNLELYDENDQLVIEKCYTVQHVLIRQQAISSTAFWEVQHLLFRP
jgi:hypothetical protein